MDERDRSAGAKSVDEAREGADSAGGTGARPKILGIATPGEPRRTPSGVMTAPPPVDHLFTTSQMRPFELAVVLAKVEAPEPNAPPSLLAPAGSVPAPQAPTPIVEISKSDIERLEWNALGSERVPEAPALPPPADATSSSGIEFPTGQLAVLELPVVEEKVKVEAGPESVDELYDEWPET